MLAEEAEANARELWRAAQAASPGLSVPFDVVYAIALLHFYRYAALPLGQDRNDLQVALVLFAHIYRVDPELVPNHLLQMQTSDDDDELVLPDNVGLVWDHSLMFPAFPDAYSSRNYPFSDGEIIVGPDWWMRQADVLLSEPRPVKIPRPLSVPATFYARRFSIPLPAIQPTPSGCRTSATRSSSNLNRRENRNSSTRP